MRKNVLAQALTAAEHQPFCPQRLPRLLKVVQPTATRNNRFGHRASCHGGRFGPQISQLLPGLGAVFGEDLGRSLQQALYCFIMRCQEESILER
jgi:hypothetical protein